MSGRKKRSTNFSYMTLFLSKDTATTKNYTLALLDALPIYSFAAVEPSPVHPGWNLCERAKIPAPAISIAARKKNRCCF